MYKQTTTKLYTDGRFMFEKLESLRTQTKSTHESTNTNWNICDIIKSKLNLVYVVWTLVPWNHFAIGGYIEAKKMKMRFMAKKEETTQ